MNHLTATHPLPDDREMDSDWLYWSLAFADPTLRTDVRTRILQRAHRRATDPTTRTRWLTLVGDTLAALVGTLPDWEPWFDLAHDGPHALQGYTWEQRLTDLEWLSVHTPDLDLLPHPHHPATAEILTRLFTSDRTDHDHWLTDTDHPWPIIEDTLRVVLTLVRCHHRTHTAWIPHHMAADTTLHTRTAW